MEQKTILPFHDRRLITHYGLFFSGALALVYQALGFSLLGDSVEFLCLVAFIGGFSISRKFHILENAFLMTLGYILPLVIRNSMKLTYAEAPSLATFLQLGFQSTLSTFILGLVFSALALLTMKISGTLLRHSKGRISTRSESHLKELEY